MAHTVSWMVTRERPEDRARAGGVALRAFLGGGLLGGAAAGALVLALAAPLGALPAQGRLAILAGLAAAVAAAYAGRAAGWWRVPAPEPARQVPEAWRELLSTRAAALAYGAGLGFSFATHIRSLALYPLLVLSLGLAHRPLAPVAVLAVAGLARSAALVAAPARGWLSAPGERVVAALDAAEPVARRLEAVILLAGAGALVAWLLTTYR